MNILEILFGQSKRETDREVIVRLMEERHEQRKAMDLLQERYGELLYGALRIIEQFSPEEASSFHEKHAKTN